MNNKITIKMINKMGMELWVAIINKELVTISYSQQGLITQLASKGYHIN